MKDDIDFFYETAPHLRAISVDPAQKSQQTQETAEQAVDIESLPIINQTVSI